ncbi:MAG: hypothetical protein EP314_08665 [Bacteroidetes bacterium]|nr:MAG: hypothetical protein EP314_08665 [Bacteroidota bacterium]
MIWLKRVFFIALALILVGMAVVGILVLRYEDDMKQYALETVRSSIETEVHFDENVVLSIWKDFPLVAVEIRELQVQDAFRTDTLLQVQNAFVQFDVWNLLQNRLTIAGIRLEDGFVRVHRTADDRWNFRVWKAQESSGGNTDLNIEILTLNKINVEYHDRSIDLDIHFYSERSKLKGRFTDDNTRLGLSLAGFLSYLRSGGEDRILELPLTLAGVLNIQAEDGIYTIEMGNAVMAGNEMVFDAQWSRIDTGTLMEMKLHAGNMEPGMLLPHVWPQMPENIRDLNLTGQADLILSLVGPLNKTQGPQLDAVLRMRDGGLTFMQTEVRDLNFEGKLFMKDIKRSKALTIDFDAFDLRTPNGSVTGKGKLTDLTNPRLTIECEGNSRIEEIIQVARLEEHVSGKGAISWNIDLDGPLGYDFKTSVNELRQMRWSGSVALSDAELRFSEDMPLLSELNARIDLEPSTAFLRECSGQLGHLRFDGEVQLANFNRLLTEENESIRVTGSIHINELDIQKLPNEWKFRSETSGSKELGNQISVEMTTSIDRILYNDFTANAVSGTIQLNNDLLNLRNLQFEALGGSIRTQLQFSPNENGYMLALNGDLSNIDMSRTLSEWNEFGQQTITSKNLKGRASAQLDAQIVLNSKYELLRDRLKVDADLEISGGELIRFEPLQAMSKFISVDELEQVKFDTLRNRLTIENGVIHIPRMTVSSSILNVMVFGEHAFDQEMDYHVNLLLNDLLRRKAKKKEMFDGHEIVDEKGKTRLFLWIRGRPGNIKVGFDKKEVRQKIKDDLRTEGQTIKELFKNEFSGGPSKVEETQEVQFRLEDDGISKPKQPTNTSEKPKPTETEKPKKKKGFFNTEPETEETEGGFEIEFDP